MIDRMYKKRQYLIVHNLFAEKLVAGILPFRTLAAILELVFGPLAVPAFSGSPDMDNLHRRFNRHIEPLVGVVIPSFDPVIDSVVTDDAPKTGLETALGDDSNHGLQRC